MPSTKQAKPAPKPIKMAKETTTHEPAPVEETKSTADKYKELLKQAEDLKAAAVAELKADIATKIMELNSYGYSYRLADRDPFSPNMSMSPRRTRTPSSNGKGPSYRFDPTQHCSVCGIKGHNTRAHNLHKAAFTPEELAAKGWQVPVQVATN